jgi:hypothetical protein
MVYRVNSTKKGKDSVQRVMFLSIHQMFFFSFSKTESHLVVGRSSCDIIP